MNTRIDTFKQTASTKHSSLETTSSVHQRNPRRTNDDVLSTLPFEQLEKLRSIYGKEVHTTRTQISVSKRKTKNHPMEISSKHPLPLFKDVSVPGLRKRSHDPRFSSSSGNFHETKFRSDYAFLYDEYLPAEAAQLQRMLKTTSDKKEKEKLRLEFSAVQQRIGEEKERRRRQETFGRIKTTEMRAVKDGKKPYFAKKRELKQAQLIDKFNQMKKEGKLEKYVQKKRRKKEKHAHGH